jgi:hypothetical protein
MMCSHALSGDDSEGGCRNPCVAVQCWLVNIQARAVPCYSCALICISQSTFTWKTVSWLWQATVCSV